MTGQLVILKQSDKAFRRACLELEISFRCIGEGIHGDKYELEFDEISDIYSLSGMVTMQLMNDFENKLDKELEN